MSDTSDSSKSNADKKSVITSDFLDKNVAAERKTKSIVRRDVNYLTDQYVATYAGYDPHSSTILGDRKRWGKKQVKTKKPATKITELTQLERLALAFTIVQHRDHMKKYFAYANVASQHGHPLSMNTLDGVVPEDRPTDVIKPKVNCLCLAIAPEEGLQASDDKKPDDVSTLPNESHQLNLWCSHAIVTFPTWHRVFINKMVCFIFMC